jgi:hypothetical protein
VSGQQASRWLVAGGYDAIAKPVFAHVRAHRLLLEYDDERSGSFGPLRLIRDDITIVLGLVTTKTAHQETPDELAAWIREASRFVGLAAWLSARSAAFPPLSSATPSPLTTSAASWRHLSALPRPCGLSTLLHQDQHSLATLGRWGNACSQTASRSSVDCRCGEALTANGRLLAGDEM